MKISSVRIRNYRSIKELTVNLSDHSVLLGPNNAGKSNILRAIEFGLSTRHAQREEHSGFDEKVPVSVEIAAVCESNSERWKFRRLCWLDGSIRLRKTADRYGTTYSGLVRQPEDPTLKCEFVESLPGTALATHPCARFLRRKHGVRYRDLEKVSALRAYWASLGPQANLSESWSRNNEEVISAWAEALPQVVFLPAMPESGDAALGGTGLVAKLIQLALPKRPYGGSVGIAGGGGVFAELEKSFNTPMASGRAASLGRIEKLLSDGLADWDAAVAFRLSLPDYLDFVRSHIRVLVRHDNAEGDASNVGHGLQRAVVLSMIRALSGFVVRVPDGAEGRPRKKSGRSTLLIVEEPEVFLHPHAQRRFARELRAIAAASIGQVLVASHSPQFVDVAKPNEIAIVSKASATLGTKVRQAGPPDPQLVPRHRGSDRNQAAA
jgi:putative ATP-dependent endonuclease of the OLD family